MYDDFVSLVTSLRTWPVGPVEVVLLYSSIIISACARFLY
jgi:hypothetical protein